ncbi:hypothetical protein, partial [Alkalibacterium sp. m-11]
FFTLFFIHFFVFLSYIDYCHLTTVVCFPAEGKVGEMRKRIDDGSACCENLHEGIPIAFFIAL